MTHPNYILEKHMDVIAALHPHPQCNTHRSIGKNYHVYVKNHDKVWCCWYCNYVPPVGTVIDLSIHSSSGAPLRVIVE